MNRELAPVVLFTYNRPEHTKKTLEALTNNYLASDSILYVFSDAARNEKDEKKVEEVREVISHIEGFKKVECILQVNNKGLANSIIDGVSKIIAKHKKVIVLEDDLITSKMFLYFMNDALDTYKSREQIWSISGYHPPITLPSTYKESVYLSFRGSSWGWATWADRWNTIDWNTENYKYFLLHPLDVYKLSRGGCNLVKMLQDCVNKKNNSWAVRSCYAQALQDRYTVYPTKSLVKSIGTDGSGTNFTLMEKRFDCEIQNCFLYDLKSNIAPNPTVIKVFKSFFDISIVRYLKRKIRR